ncbi:MAG: hypothetical protein MUF51_02230, partial [Vicinamibacteria bacterium]|nr:hypothetical protein [Vicinamibacteria bacterium]
MNQLNVENLTRSDCVLIATHYDDPALACTGRLLAEQAKGSRMLQVTIFADAARHDDVLAQFGIEELQVGLPEATRRQAVYAPLSGRL